MNDESYVIYERNGSDENNEKNDMIEVKRVRTGLSEELIFS